MSIDETMDLDSKIYWAYVETLDWSICDYAPEDFVCDYFDEDEFEFFREQFLANMVKTK